MEVKGARGKVDDVRVGGRSGLWRRECGIVRRGAEPRAGATGSTRNLTEGKTLNTKMKVSHSMTLGNAIGYDTAFVM